MSSAGGRGCSSSHEFPRLIITRTFSKAMGMAGLRLGYLMAHPDLAAQIAKAKLPYNVNQFSLTAAQVALDHRERFRPAIESILRERERLRQLLSEIPGVRLYPTGRQLLPVPAGSPAASGLRRAVSAGHPDPRRFRLPHAFELPARHGGDARRKTTGSSSALRDILGRAPAAFPEST